MPLKILQANIDNKNLGGAFILIKKIEFFMKEMDVVFDYITMDEFVEDVANEYKTFSASKVYSARLRKNRVWGHFKLPFYVYSVLNNNFYDAIHINTDSSWKALLYAVPAKIAGVNTIIVHSHSTGSDGKCQRLKVLLHCQMKKILNKITDVRLACSDEAARWMFSSKLPVDYNVIFNGIKLAQYQFDYKVRMHIRKELGYSEELVIGNVGLVSETKNQLFQLEILQKVRSQGINAVLLLVGNCTKKWKVLIEKKAKALGVYEYVRIYGASNCIPELLCGMDVFLFPSKFEGFSVAVLEAQAMGLPCIISDTVPDISTVSSWVERVYLNAGADEWANRINLIGTKFQGDREQRVISNIYDISNSAKNLMKYYGQIRGKE